MTFEQIYFKKAQTCGISPEAFNTTAKKCGMITLFHIMFSISVYKCGKEVSINVCEWYVNLLESIKKAEHESLQ